MVILRMRSSDVVPRITAEHERQVRERILSAALRVFAEKGYRGSTMGDVVRESGLSVGAIYTYFPSKEALFLNSCDIVAEQGLDVLAERLAPAATTAERLAIAVALYVETIDEFDGRPGQITLVHAWAEADTEPGVREMLVRRRERLVGAGQLLLREGIVRGELASWLDVDATARALTALLDGLLLQRIEAGPGHRPEDSLRRARAVVDVLLATAPAERQTVPTA